MFSRKQRTLAPYADLIPAFYCRVSSDEQAEQTNVSIPDQIKTTQNFAQRLEMKVFDNFVLLEDEKGSTLERPQLHVLRQWIKEQRITAVVVRSTDRLSRSPGNGEILFDEMLKYGVRFFVTMHQREFDLRSINDRDMLLQEMMFNRRWLRMLTDTMAWGKRGRIERGNPAMGGGTKYGFSKWKDANKVWHYELSDEAANVQSIYHWLVVDHVNVFEIQRRLKGKPTPKELSISADKLSAVKKRNAGEWSLSSIYNILRDPAYKGELTLYKNSSEYDPIVIQIPIVVNEDIWNAAQTILDNGKKMSKRNTKHEFLLARLLTCPCGATLHTEQMKKKRTDTESYYHYYRCGRNDAYKSYANKDCTAQVRTWNADIIDTALWAWFIRAAETPELIQNYLEESKQHADEINKPILERLAQLEITQKRWEQKLLNLLNLYSDRNLNDPQHRIERIMLERARDEAAEVFNDIENEKVELQNRLIHQSISSQFIDAWTDYAKRNRHKILYFTFQQKRQAIESLGITASPIVTEHGERYLLVYMYGQYAEHIPLTDSLQSSSEVWNELQILIARIPLPNSPQAH